MLNVQRVCRNRPSSVDGLRNQAITLKTPGSGLCPGQRSMSVMGILRQLGLLDFPPVVDSWLKVCWIQ
jgi:hypothetical protein